ncbi:UDP-N-acetylmuramate dehydrogenase [Verrucomicrobia bacterium]|nr:UDP-N-acetylmuramate dehydrogenase [Verrucomicrobiota bacterium]
MKTPAKSAKKPLKVAIACGGTGGHLFPGVAVADMLRDMGHQALLILSDKQVDREAADAVDHLAVTLPSAAWQRGSKLKFVGKLGKGLLTCRSIYRRHQPDAVMAMGGFTSLAPVMMARMQRLPVFLHESNTIAGRAVRKLASSAHLGFLGFECAKESFSGLKCRVTGTPVRESLRNLNRDQCHRELGFQPGHPLLLVTGGSQGALGINRCVMTCLSSLKSAVPDIQVLHQCGHQDDAQKIRQHYKKYQISAKVYPFFHRMDLALGASDAAIGRSGASFMAELAATRLPSLLVPFPSSADGHQLSNAQTLEASGAAVCIEESAISADQLTNGIKTLLLDRSVRLEMKSALASLDRPDAAKQIVQQILQELGCVEKMDAPRNNALADSLREKLSRDSLVKVNEPLGPKTTMKVGGKADFYVQPASRADLAEILKWAVRTGLLVTMLGRGSNLLIREGGIRGVVISLGQACFSEIKVEGDRLICGAGVRLKRVSETARKAGLSGLEFFEGIPGCVGGALRMNAGAMKSWAFEPLIHLTTMDRQGLIHKWNAEDVEARYRQCPLLKEHIALEAVFEGTPEDPKQIKQAMDDYSQRRRQSQPIASSAGCMFKNPTEISAGKLIEELGLKGAHVGDAMISEVHANFIVNRGNATSDDVLTLIERVRTCAKSKRNIDLEVEVQVMGE